jgi:hypothetical protein
MTMSETNALDRILDSVLPSGWALHSVQFRRSEICKVVLSRTEVGPEPLMAVGRGYTLGEALSKAAGRTE